MALTIFVIFGLAAFACCVTAIIRGERFRKMLEREVQSLLESDASDDEAVKRIRDIVERWKRKSPLLMQPITTTRQCANMARQRPKRLWVAIQLEEDLLLLRS